MIGGYTLRVKGVAIALLIVLLAAGSLAPPAGAIYIEGQTIPDDGLPHILAAGGGSPVAPAPDSGARNSGPVFLTGISRSGISGLSQAFPSMHTEGILPSMGMRQDAFKTPDGSTAAPEDKYTSGIPAGKSLSPAVAGYWNFAEPGGMRADMPGMSWMPFHSSSQAI